VVYPAIIQIDSLRQVSAAEIQCPNWFNGTLQNTEGRERDREHDSDQFDFTNIWANG